MDIRDKGKCTDVLITADEGKIESSKYCAEILKEHLLLGYPGLDSVIFLYKMQPDRHQEWIILAP